MDDDSYDSRQPESVAAVLKVFAILQAPAERSDIGISDLSVRLAMPKATVYRFLQTMRTLGHVPKESDTERYGLTMRMYELGARSLHQEVRRPHPLRSHSPSDRNNHVCARLSVSFPSFRYDMACEPELVAMLPDASRAISRQLGCSPFPLDAAAGPR